MAITNPFTGLIEKPQEVELPAAEPTTTTTKSDFTYSPEQLEGIYKHNPDRAVELGYTPPSPVNVVDTNQLESDNNLKLPSSTEPDKFVNVTTDITTDPRVEHLRNEQNELKGDIEDKFDEMATKGQFTADAEEEAGLYEAQKEKTEIDNQIRQKERDFDLAIRDAEDAFGTRAQKSAVKAEITKEYNRELADLSIIQMARAGNLADAQAYVDRKVQLEFQDKQAELDKLMWLYGENKERFTLEEQRAFEARIAAEEKEYAEQLAERTQFENFKLSLLTTAISNGAGNAVLQQIQGAKDMESLLRIQGIAGVASSGTGGYDVPTVKSINGVDMQWNPVTGQWEEITVGATTDKDKETLAQLDLLRDSTARILGMKYGGADYTGEGLYEGASPNPTAEFVRRNIGSSSTKYTQLQTYVDTLRSNVLTLTTDPNIKKFFGPQMSEADVRLMTAAGTTLRPDEQSPEQLYQEAVRLDDMFNRMQTAVKTGIEAGGACQGVLITAPSGELVCLID